MEPDRSEITQRFYVGDALERSCANFFNEEHRGHTMMAHNFRTYDGHFFLKWLTNNNFEVRVSMYRGKILQILVPELEIRLADPLNSEYESRFRAMTRDRMTVDSVVMNKVS